MRYLIIDKTFLNPDFGGILIIHGKIKLNKMNSHSLTWIFASKNGFIHAIILEIIFDDKMYSNWKKIFIMDAFLIVETELNEITLKR